MDFGLYRAITNDNKSLWPDLGSLARLNDMQGIWERMPSNKSSKNNPIPDNQRASKRPGFKISVQNVLKLVNRFVTVDPAIALGEKNDDTTICIVSVDSRRTCTWKNVFREK